MGGKLSFDDEAISDINVVPLVDIVLVVLIIFMVTAPMFMKPSINVNLPKAASGEASTPSQLSISITKAGEIVLNGTKADEDAIKAKAQELAMNNPEIQAIIAADQGVEYGKVVRVIDLVKGSGVKKFAISIEKAQ
ncbi:MAG: biopolymer transporter ExbD [Bdellovibrionaceae bacterium]|nr:biopolymer transporter ExbD [Pseudobdellovibrionaceae bacterium]